MQNYLHVSSNMIKQSVEKAFADFNASPSQIDYQSTLHRARNADPN